HRRDAPRRRRLRARRRGGKGARRRRADDPLMPLPSLLAAQTSVAPPAKKKGRAVSPVAGRAAALNLTMEHQEQINWCWSAVGVSEKKFYAPADATRQCEQAAHQLNRTSCCNNPSSCDQPWMLDPALFTRAVGLVFPFAMVKEAVDAR